MSPNIYKEAVNASLDMLEPVLFEYVEPLLRLVYGPKIPGRFYNGSETRLELYNVLKFLKDAPRKQNIPTQNKRLIELAAQVFVVRCNACHSGVTSATEAELFLAQVAEFLRALNSPSEAEKVDGLRHRIIAPIQNPSKTVSHAKGMALAVQQAALGVDIYGSIQAFWNSTILSIISKWSYEFLVRAHTEDPMDVQPIQTKEWAISLVSSERFPYLGARLTHETTDEPINFKVLTCKATLSNSISIQMGIVSLLDSEEWFGETESTTKWPDWPVYGFFGEPVGTLSDIILGSEDRYSISWDVEIVEAELEADLVPLGRMLKSIIEMPNHLNRATTWANSVVQDSARVTN